MSSSSTGGRLSWTVLLRLLAIAALALAVQGYHLGADDAAIYVPGIKKAADAALYPFGAEFFESHAHLTLFPNLVGGVARVSGLPADAVIFGCHFAGILLLLAGAWRLMGVCFEDRCAQWSGVLFLGVLLSVSVTGTALAIADPYVTSRTLSTPATLLAIAGFVSGRRKAAFAWLAATALLHPQMSFFCACFLACFAMMQKRAVPSLRSAAAMAHAACFLPLPFLFALEPASGPAREALFSRTYFFVSTWTWYEWVGVFAPLAILAWFSVARFPGVRPAFRSISRSLVPFSLVFTLAAVVLNSSPRLENYTRLQPMRALHLVYVIFFLFLGGLMGHYVLRRRVWRWLVFFVPLAALMGAIQFAAYPASPHVEWPGASQKNAWTAAFLWIRSETPKDAVFAIDPYYMSRAGEDMHGFRAVAERSVLADAVKDSGAVSLFPQLAETWKHQVDALPNWERPTIAGLEALEARYPVTWIVESGQPTPGLVCPYHASGITVCRMPLPVGTN
jgi:hypothetical protein